jgi:hypothetical protein
LVTELDQHFQEMFNTCDILIRPMDVLALLSTINGMSKHQIYVSNQQGKESVLYLIKKLMSNSQFKLFVIQYKFRKEVKEFIIRGHQLISQLDPNFI